MSKDALLVNKIFPTGATRSSDADGFSFQLIPPEIFRTLASIFKEGEQKYTAFNWEKGMPASDLLNHAMLHYTRFLEGDTEEDNLGKVLWNIGAAIHSLRYWPELNRDFLSALENRHQALHQMISKNG